jgi:hypothetical protein
MKWGFAQCPIHSFGFAELVRLKPSSVLLLAQKKRTKEKESENANFSLFVRPLHKALTAPPKRLQFTPFSVLPTHRNDKFLFLFKFLILTKKIPVFWELDFKRPQSRELGIGKKRLF